MLRLECARYNLLRKTYDDTKKALFLRRCDKRNLSCSGAIFLQGAAKYPYPRIATDMALNCEFDLADSVLMICVKLVVKNYMHKWKPFFRLDSSSDVGTNKSKIRKATYQKAVVLSLGGR